MKPPVTGESRPRSSLGNGHHDGAFARPVELAEEDVLKIRQSEPASIERDRERR
jgi:hypothetical protein